jgi:ligand-binding sensor domain-containing protein/AraC-like DNA-binding protein
MNSFRKYIAGFFLFWSTLAGIAQPLPSYLQHYSVEDGLPQHTVMDILQDRKGFLWFATWDGFSKFDGRTFKNYKVQSGGNSRTEKITEEANGCIQLHTYDGSTYCFDPKTETFKQLSAATDATTTTPNTANDTLLTDRYQQIWYATNELGIFKFDPATGITRRFQVKTEDAFMAKDPAPPIVIQDIYGQIWVQPRGGGFSFYNHQKDALQPFYDDPDSPDYHFSNILHHAYSDRQGNLWLSTHSNGLEKVVFVNNNFTTKKINPHLKSSTANEVRAVLQDNENKIWVSTKNSELSVYDENFKHLGDFAADGSVRHNQSFPGSVYSMLQDAAGNIWIGTKGEGVFKARKNGNRYTVEQYKHNNEPNSLSDNAVYSIFQDSKKNIWIGTFGGGINLVQTDSSGKITFIHSRNGLKNYPIATAHRVRYITENKFGNICVGTAAGLICFSATFTAPEKINYRQYTLSDTHGICNTRSGEMFLATYGGGLNKVIAFDAQGFPEKFQSYTEQNGLPSNVCLAILEDEYGKLWISGGNTLVRFDPKTEKFENYTEVRRLLSKYNFSEASAIVLRNHDMIFGFSDGILTFSPQKVKESTFKPYVALSDFRLFNRPVIIGGKDSPLTQDIDDTEKLELKHNQNFLSISFTALDFVSPENILYAYKLEGYDSEWIYSQKQRVANYTNLPTGKYVFHVKSTNHEGIWIDNERSLPIRIAPPFYASAWAYCLYFLLIVGLGFAVIHYYILRKSSSTSEQPGASSLVPLPDVMNPQDEAFINKVAQIIENNLDNSEFSVEDICTTLGMSRSVFFNKLKNLTGLPPVEFIRNLRIQRAAQLLESNEYLVKEVSYMVGISDIKYFTKCFKKQFGVTPQEYKNSTRNRQE